MACLEGGRLDAFAGRDDGLDTGTIVAANMPEVAIGGSSAMINAGRELSMAHQAAFSGTAYHVAISASVRHRRSMVVQDSFLGRVE